MRRGGTAPLTSALSERPQCSEPPGPERPVAEGDKSGKHASKPERPVAEGDKSGKHASEPERAVAEGDKSGEHVAR